MINKKNVVDSVGERIIERPLWVPLGRLQVFFFFSSARTRKYMSNSFTFPIRLVDEKEK